MTTHAVPNAARAMTVTRPTERFEAMIELCGTLLGWTWI